MVRIIIGHGEPYDISNEGIRDFEALLSYMMRFAMESITSSVPQEHNPGADRSTRVYVIARILLDRVRREIARQDKDSRPVPKSVKERRA